MQRSIWWLVAVTTLAVALPGPLRAQDFAGTGQRTTEFFELDEGPVVFEMEYRGEGRFAVRLLSERGEVVEELASASGRFSGTKAVRIAEEDRYLLEVVADGAWIIHLEEVEGGAAAGAPGALAGRAAGAAAASGVSTTGWLVRGLVGGLLAGPIGGAVAVGMAAGSDAEPPPLPAAAAGGPAYREGFEEGFRAQLRRERRKKAFIGGMLGTAAFVFAVIQIADLTDSDPGSAVGNPEPPGTELVRVPVR